MIVLKADSELKMTFERLIKTMHANVNWTGLFVALDFTGGSALPVFSF